MADDRTARARLRDAAIEIVAEAGSAALSARRVAGRAEVSAGLVAHHFGSMDGLQQACDAHIAAVIRDEHDAAMSRGFGAVDPLASARASGSKHVVAYLARRMADPAESVTALIDAMVSDALRYLRHGERAGMVRPSDDPVARASYAVLCELGLVVLHEHVRRHLGIDLTRADLAEDPHLPRFMAVSIEVMGTGVFTDEAVGELGDRLGEP